MTKQKNLLLVEDDKKFRKSLEVVLKKYFNVDTAGSEEEALELLSKKDYDIVSIDGAFPKNKRGKVGNHGQLSEEDFRGDNVAKAANQEGIYTVGLTAEPEMLTEPDVVFKKIGLVVMDYVDVLQKLVGKKNEINELEQEVKKISQKLKGRKTILKKLEQEHSSLEENTEKAIVKEKLGDLYSSKREIMREKEDAIINVVRSMNDDERLVIGNFLYDQGVISFCSGGFGGYKSPTTCGGCHEGERNVGRLDLEKYVKFYGDRVYGIPDDVVDQARSSLSKKSIQTIRKNLENKISNMEDEVGKLRRKINEGEELINIYKGLESNKVDYKKVQELMPDFIKLIKNTSKGRVSVQYVTAKPDEGIGVILTDESAYYGTGGSEYGVSVIVFRDGDTKSEYFKWRDPYSPTKDKPWLSFKRAQIVKTTKDSVTVKLKSSSNEITKTYSLKKKQKKILEDKLNEQEQEEFLEKYEQEKGRLIDVHYRKKGLMPDYINYTFFEGNLPSGAVSGEAIPYEKPEIVDEFKEPEQGTGVVVIKAQIDHGAGRGKQYEWVVYKITPDSSEMIARDNAYQDQLRAGKRIDMKASQLYKEVVEKKKR